MDYFLILLKFYLLRYLLLKLINVDAKTSGLSLNLKKKKIIEYEKYFLNMEFYTCEFFANKLPKNVIKRPPGHRKMIDFDFSTKET